MYTRAEKTFSKYAKLPVHKISKIPKAKTISWKESPRVKSIIKSFREDFIPGALATGVTTGVLYPMDTIQMREQTGSPKPKKKKDYYKGVKMKLMKAVPTGALMFGLKPAFRALVK